MRARLGQIAGLSLSEACAGGEPIGITVWGYGGRISCGYTDGLGLELKGPIE